MSALWPTAVTRSLIAGAVAALILTAVPFAAAPAQAGLGQATAVAASAEAAEFDLQSHRGGRGEWTESSLAAFANSLEVGVSTIELDTKVTEDDVVMVWHDDTIQAEKCQDTEPAFEADPEYPYVGDRIRELSYAQLQTLDCGYQQLPDYPLQDVIEDNKLATLEEVFELVRAYEAEDIHWNIETKIEDPEDLEHRQVLVSEVVETIDEDGWPKNTQLQSFDWDALDQAGELDPRLELVALAAAENPDGAGMSPRDVAERGYSVWSPSYDLLTEENIAAAQELGLEVVPWTVNNRVEMEQLIDWGVDGIITDYPSVLRDAMDDRGMELPQQYESPSAAAAPRGGSNPAEEPSAEQAEGHAPDAAERTDPSGDSSDGPGASGSSGDGSNAWGLILPVDTYVTSGFGWRLTPPGTLDYGGDGGHLHRGTDFGGGCGLAVKAATSGEVSHADAAVSTAGNRVVLSHGTVNHRDLVTKYHHLTHSVVAAGQQVQAGQVIGYTGSTGNSTGCHLHFETILDGTAVDPLTLY